jgi:hypothetical protein
MVAEPQFSSLVGQIEVAYERLGHQLGWRFLYSPARTLAPETRLATVGANPGGRIYERPSPSVEEGNAYRVETWPGAGQGGLNPLQTQIGLFYKALARKLPDSSPARLMDDTLATNFCPFRSPSWDSLANRTESIAFSRELWRTILGFVSPSVLVCLGELPARELRATLVSTGSRLLGAPEVRLVGWGRMTYELAHYQSSSARILLVRLPHPSRFGIFGRAPSQAAVERLTSVIAAAMTGNGPPLPSKEAPEPRLSMASPEPHQAVPGRPLRARGGTPPLVPYLPSPEAQAAARQRGEPLIVSCSARPALGRAITWITLEPDGSYRVDGPSEHGFPVGAIRTFSAALRLARFGVPADLRGEPGGQDPATR